MTSSQDSPDAPLPARPGESPRMPPGGVIDQRQQQIDPAGHHRQDPNRQGDDNTKQPGGSDPQRRDHHGEGAPHPDRAGTNEGGTNEGGGNGDGPAAP